MDTLQNLWHSSGAVIQNKWEQWLDTYGDRQEPYWVYGSTLVIFIVYWTLGGLYTIMDLTGQPAFLKRDVPPDHEPVTLRRVLKVVEQALINQFLIDLPVRYVAIPILMWRGVEPLRVLPSARVILAHCLICLVAYDFSIYYCHRLLHHRRLYKHFHKVHHEWTSPIGITAFYCHPVEQLLSNTFPPVLGVVILGPHVVTAWIWATYVVILGVSSHTGFHLLPFPNPAAHDFHHSQFNQCYGVLGLLDWLHGTDSAYRKHMKSKQVSPK